MRDIYNPHKPETYQEKVKPLLIPVKLSIPDEVADRMPKRKLRDIRGVFWLRFYPKLPPSIGHSIEFRGHRWRIAGITHPVQIKNSPAIDFFPQFETEYLGVIE
jgi:hypothetical protein